MTQKIEHKSVDSVEYKRCSKCQEWLPLSAFNRNHTASDGMENKKLYRDARYSNNLDYCRQLGRDNYFRNKDHRMRYNQLEETRERDRQDSRQYYQQHTVECLARVKKYQEDNPDKVSMYHKKASALRRASKRVGDKITNEEWHNLCEEVNYCCVYCGKNFTFTELTMDHLLPLSRGGQHTLSNILPACRSCNSKKGTKTFAEYLGLEEGN